MKTGIERKAKKIQCRLFSVFLEQEISKRETIMISFLDKYIGFVCRIHT